MDVEWRPWLGRHQQVPSITDFADLKANHMSTHGHDVWIDGGKGDVLVLKGVDIHDLDKGDFIF